MTESEAAAAEYVSSRKRARPQQPAALDALWEAAEGLRPPAMLYAINQPALASMPGVLLWAGRDAEAPQTEDDHAAAGRMLGEALVAPLRALGLDPTDWPEAVKAQYLGTLLASLQPLVHLSWHSFMRRRIHENEEEE